MRIDSTLTLALIICVIATSLQATPLRLRHSSKRVTTTDPSGQPRILVDRDGKPLPKPFWKDDNPEGTPRIEVDLAEQVARVYFDDILVGQSPISSGRPGNETPVGEFTILSKKENHASNLYGSWIDSEGNYKGEANAGDKAPSGLTYQAAPMPHFMRLTYDGIGFHAGFIPGYPASHGCMRMPKDMAEKFFEHLPKNTKVVIIDSDRPAAPTKPVAKKKEKLEETAVGPAKPSNSELQTAQPPETNEELSDITPELPVPAQNTSESPSVTASEF